MALWVSLGALFSSSGEADWDRLRRSGYGLQDVANVGHTFFILGLGYLPRDIIPPAPVVGQPGWSCL